MKIATSELEHLREEVKNCHCIIKDLQNKREFVGLTDEEFQYCVELKNFEAIAEEVEAKLKEKNT